jgi:hypothetical protein
MRQGNCLARDRSNSAKHAEKTDLDHALAATGKSFQRWKKVGGSTTLPIPLQRRVVLWRTCQPW